MKTLVIERINRNRRRYRAYLEDAPSVYGESDTRVKAVGEMILSDPHYFKLWIVETEASK